MATIREHPGDGPRQWRIQVEATIGGKRHRASKVIIASRKRDAEAEAARWEAQWRASLLPESRRGTTTFAEVWERWIADRRRLGRAESTLHGYSWRFTNWIEPTIGALPVREVKATHLNDIYQQMSDAKNEPASIRQVHAIIRGALSAAEKWDLADRNVARLADPPMLSPPKLELPDAADVMRVIDGLREPLHRQVCLLLAVTGCRRGEVMALRWDDVDHEARTIRIDESAGIVDGRRIIKDTKTKVERVISVDAETWAETIGAAWDRVMQVAHGKPEPQWHVFTWVPGGDFVDPDLITGAWRRSASRSKVDMPLKNLRHWASTMELDAGISIATVASRRGHSDGGRMTLARYTTGTRRSDQRAADAVAAALRRPTKP